ncbi:hypothetical protein FNV43_RR22334 [Rhamnella rubrinervis]|uniref:Cytochrome P450 n=1 Tax=Rhamnella rubrinervis TaxID=2594499 RepID=A0A8K0E1S7_9ROSA|nr:hypothetical protein FNV43_RR22334 [Rhamnella rubrinervis]
MPYFLPTSICLVLFILSFLRKRSKAQVSSILELAPGPWKLPVIGNLHQLIGTLPHRSLRNLAKKYGPVMHLQVGEIPFFVISSPQGAKEMMKTHDLHFAQRRASLAGEYLSYGNSGISFAPYGDQWRQLRKICVVELLSAKRVHAYRSIREEEAWNMIKSISASCGLAIDLSEKLLSYTNDVTSRSAFGNKCKEQEEFISLLDQIRQLTGGFKIADVFPSLRFLLGYATGMTPALRKSHKKLDKILDIIINHHKVKRQNLATTGAGKPGGEDVIDVLLNLQESGMQEFKITMNHVKAVALDIFSAGSETSATTLEWAMSELLRNPRVLTKAQEEVRRVLKGKKKIQEIDIHELDYLKSVVKETLRLHPPVSLITRVARERCEVNGYEVPADTKFIINLFALGRDPEYWVDAGSFKPERFDGSSIDYKGNSFEFLPFGGGRRICPGISLGAANVELVLSQLLYHFDWKLGNGNKPEELDMEESFGVSCRRKNYLDLIPTQVIPFAY